MYVPSLPESNGIVDVGVTVPAIALICDFHVAASNRTVSIPHGLGLSRTSRGGLLRIQSPIVGLNRMHVIAYERYPHLAGI